MSSINSRVPPLRLAAVDTPADGEVAAYQSSSGQFEWVANGSGGGGTVTSVALTETGSALTITGSPITGSGTINIAGAGNSSQVILGDLSLGALTSGTVTSVSSSQAFITITDGTTTPSISIGNAGASATGVLTSTDWNTFNSKAPNTSSYLTLGTDAGLTNERVLTAGTGIGFTDTGAGGTLTIESTVVDGVTSVSGTSPISVTDGTSTPTISLDDTAVTPGSYTSADITVDAKGRITAASNGSGGGGSPGGSDTQIQYNNGGSFGGSSVMTFDDTAAAEQVLFSGTSSKAIFKVEQLGAGNSIEVHDAATDSTIFLVDQFGRAAIKTNAVSSGYDLTVGGSTFVQGHLKLSTVGTTANPAIKWDGDTTTGINKPTNGEIAIVSAGTETFRFGANNDLEIAGNAGNSGQVFTSGGAGAAASWTTPSGIDPLSFSTSQGLAVTAYWLLGLNPAYSSAFDFQAYTTSHSGFLVKFQPPFTGTSGIYFYTSVASASANNFLWIYEESSTGYAGTFVAKILLPTSTTGGQSVTQWLDAAGSNITAPEFTRGDTYIAVLEIGSSFTASSGRQGNIPFVTIATVGAFASPTAELFNQQYTGDIDSTLSDSEINFFSTTIGWPMLGLSL